MIMRALIVIAPYIAIALGGLIVIRQPSWLKHQLTGRIMGSVGFGIFVFYAVSEPAYRYPSLLFALIAAGMFLRSWRQSPPQAGYGR